MATPPVNAVLVMPVRETMNVYHLGDEQVSELLGLPETGMGFQLVEATFWGDRKQFLVFNGYLAIDLSPLDLDFTADPSVIQRNEARIVETLKDSVTYRTEQNRTEQVPEV